MRLRVKESSETMEKYRKMCNEVRILARKDKQNWIEKQCSNIEQFAGEYKTREVYKLIKSINRKWQPRQTAIKNKDGKILMNREETKERWTEYCIDLYSETETDPKNKDLLNELEMISPPQRKDEDDDILYEEVERAIHQLKKGKSPGNDGIRGEMISAGGEKLKEEIYKQDNLSQ